MSDTKLGTLPRWDLSSLYVNQESEELKNDLQLDVRAKAFKEKFECKLASLSGDELAVAIKEYEDIDEVLGRLISYAYLVYAENVTDPEKSSFYQNISEKVTEISSIILFFELEINKIDDDVLQNKVASSLELKRYEPWIRDVRVMKPYQLSDEVEEVLHEKSITSRQSWNRLFDETIASLKFPYDGKELSTAEIMNLMSSKKEEERKKSAKSVGKVLGDNVKTFSLITNVLAKDKEINDRLRGFEKPISSRNLANLIEDDVTEALLATVKNNYSNIAHRYYKIKAKMFGKDSLPYWDRNAPIPNDSAKLISWEEAVDTVLTAYGDFSPEMAEIGKKFFDNNWIDAPAVDGKDSGAFSHPTVPSANPYILMNYQGKSRDVMTLAHELGHGVHQYLSAKQGSLMSDTPLTLAETASVFGEQLTFQAMLKKQTNDEQRKVMIANKVEDMINTVIRQTAFCEFERAVHDERKNGEISSDRLCEIWMNVQKESLGEGVTFEDEYKYFWSYIPHFIHSPFYVYAYSFGDCLVNSLYKVYQEQPDGFVPKYIKMLEAGGTLRHKELLEPFGLDAGNPQFWQGGIDVISGFIDQLED